MQVLTLNRQVFHPLPDQVHHFSGPRVGVARLPDQRFELVSAPVGYTGTSYTGFGLLTSLPTHFLYQSAQNGGENKPLQAWCSHCGRGFMVRSIPCS